MKKSIIYIVISFLLISLSKGNYFVTDASAAKNNMNRGIDQILNTDPSLKGALAGISIRSAETGEIIYEHLGDTRLKPASSLKLFTAAAALTNLGEDYRFTTELLTEGSFKGKVLRGNLYLKGKGDPTLLKADLDKLAKDIKNLGIKKIRGDLISDDSWYDRVRYSKDLTWNDETYYYGAPISALTVSPDKDYDAGSIIVSVTPSTRAGKKPNITLTPQTDYVKVINKARTIEKEGKSKLKIERLHGKNTIIVKGTIPIDADKKKEWIAVWEPAGYAAALFKQSLKQHGVKITGQIKAGIAPEQAQIISKHQSMPLSEIIIPFMKLSNNVHGETLIKEMGRVNKGKGSWDKGLKVFETELSKLGVNTDSLVLRDGSGISHVNLITPNELTKLLYTAQHKSWFQSYLNALPLSGEKERRDAGTLRNRMTDPSLAGKVRAKTGSLTTVSSLSGYVETKNGETLIFSIILNNLLENAKGKTIEDKIISILAAQ